MIIVGCGFTGTTALHQLVHGNLVGRITILEASGDFGPGFPYRTDESSEYLINNTNDTMCMDPGNRRAFVQWLETRDEFAGHYEEKGHLPRSVYGEFLRDVVWQSRRAAEERGIEIDLIDRECVDVGETADGAVLVHHAGGLVRGDFVILAIGRCPDRNPFTATSDLEPSYFQSHIPGQRLDAIPIDAECHVIGASLSAYDVVNQLFSRKSGCEFVPDGNNRLRFVANSNDRRVVLCSRSGRLKNAQSRYPQRIERRHFNATVIEQFADRSKTLDEVFELMRRDAEGAGVDIDRDRLLDPYRGCDDLESLNDRAAELLGDAVDEAVSPDPGANFFVDYIDDAQFDIWDMFAGHALTAEEEARYRTEFETAALSYAAPCPIPTAQKILALMDSGRLRVVKGVASVESVAEGGIEIGHDFGIEMATHVINATGAVDRDVTSEGQTTLVRNLVKRGILRPYLRGGDEAEGMEIDLSTFRCPGTRNVYAANMFLWGPGFFVSSAIAMASIVNRLLRNALS